MAPATRIGSGVRPPSKLAAAANTATAGETAQATTSSAVNGSVAPAAAAAAPEPRSSFARAFEDLLGAEDALLPSATAAPASPDEIARRLQTLEDALCTVIWPATAAAHQADASEHKEATPFDPRGFVRPTRKRPIATARAAAPLPPPPSHAAASLAAASTAATPVPATPVSLTTVAQRDREEAAIIAAIQSNNPEPLRALIAEVSAFRQSAAGASHGKAPAAATNSAASTGGAGGFIPTLRSHSSLLSALTGLNGPPLVADPVDVSAAAPVPPKLNGLALLKAKAKAKAIEAAQAAQHQQAVSQMHQNEEKASAGDGMMPHRLSVAGSSDDQQFSHIGRPRDRNPSRSSAAPTSSVSAAADSRSPSADRVVRPSRHGSFKRRRRRKKRLANLEGGPYRSRFDENGVLLPGDTSASAASAQNTEDEESAPISAVTSPAAKQQQHPQHSTMHSPVSPEHAAVLAKASAHVSSLKKKARHSRAASMSDASDNERASQLQNHQALETPPKATTGPFISSPSSQQHQSKQPPAKDSSDVFVTAPLLHSTQSSLPQLPHHLLKRNNKQQQSPQQQQHRQQLPSSSPSHLVSPSSRASLLRAPNFSAHPHSAALLASQAGLELDPDPMAPNPAVAARLAGVRVGVNSSIPGAGSSSWASSGIALPSQVHGSGASSVAGQHADVAAAARQFSPSRLQVQFDHSKHRSVPNSIEKQGGISAGGGGSVGQRAPVFAFHGGAQPNYRVPTG